MEGDEFTSNFFLEEEFTTPREEGLNEPQQDGQRVEKGPKDTVKSGLVIGGWPPKRWNGPP